MNVFIVEKEFMVLWEIRGRPFRMEEAKKTGKYPLLGCNSEESGCIGWRGQVYVEPSMQPRSHLDP